MSAPTLISRDLKNVRLYAIPLGEVVDSVTVSASTWPDNVPTTNWTNYEFLDIEGVKEAKTITKESFKLPNPAGGGYIDDDAEMVTKRMWTASTHKSNSYLRKLEHMLAAVPATTVAQAPWAVNDNYLDMVILMEVSNKSGVVIERTQVLARLRLVAAGDVGPATAKIDFSFEQRYSTNNTVALFQG